MESGEGASSINWEVAVYRQQLAELERSVRQLEDLTQQFGVYKQPSQHQAGGELRDCDGCPLMVVLAGSFTMGSPKKARRSTTSASARTTSCSPPFRAPRASRRIGRCEDGEGVAPCCSGASRPPIRFRASSVSRSSSSGSLP